jgi:hypothetical protein
MSRLSPIVAAVLTVLLAACCKSPPPAAPEANPPATSSAAPSQAPAANASAPAASATETAVEDPEVAAKKRKIEFALSEQTLANDPHGQWATSATASTTYNDAKDNASYAASQATGAPNVLRYSDDGNGWAPKDADAGIEWLQLGFARPVNATGIRVRQNSGGGAIIKLELQDSSDAWHSVYDGIDSGKYDEYNWWFKQSFARTPYLVKGAKITLATNAVSGWNEIDAVQLLSE